MDEEHDIECPYTEYPVLGTENEVPTHWNRWRRFYCKKCGKTLGVINGHTTHISLKSFTKYAGKCEKTETPL